MEIDVKLSDLQVVPNMFKDVKYYATGTISKEVETLLSNGGAQLESHITDLMTHLIVGSDPDEIEMGEVKEIYEKPVVLQSWVVLSAKCNTLLPVDCFNVDHQVLTGVRASTSQLSLADVTVAWVLLASHGGSFSKRLQPNSTHLIATSTNSVKAEKAQKTPHISIVTPDWLTDCVLKNERLNEAEYHPRLQLLTPPSPVTNKSARRFANTPKAHHIGSPSLNFNTFSGPMHLASSIEIPGAAEMMAAAASIDIFPETSQSEDAETNPELEKKKQDLVERKRLFDRLEFSDDDEMNEDIQNMDLNETSSKLLLDIPTTADSSSPENVETRTGMTIDEKRFDEEAKSLSEQNLNLDNTVNKQESRDLATSQSETSQPPSCTSSTLDTVFSGSKETNSSVSSVPLSVPGNITTLTSERPTTGSSDTFSNTTSESVTSVTMVPNPVVANQVSTRVPSVDQFTSKVLPSSTTISLSSAAHRANNQQLRLPGPNVTVTPSSQLLKNQEQQRLHLQKQQEQQKQFLVQKHAGQRPSPLQLQLQQPSQLYMQQKQVRMTTPVQQVQLVQHHVSTAQQQQLLQTPQRQLGVQTQPDVQQQQSMELQQGVSLMQKQQQASDHQQEHQQVRQEVLHATGVQQQQRGTHLQHSSDVTPQQQQYTGASSNLQQQPGVLNEQSSLQLNQEMQARHQQLRDSQQLQQGFPQHQLNIQQQKEESQQIHQGFQQHQQGTQQQKDESQQLQQSIQHQQEGIQLHQQSVEQQQGIQQKQIPQHQEGNNQLKSIEQQQIIENQEGVQQLQGIPKQDIQQQLQGTQHPPHGIQQLHQNVQHESQQLLNIQHFPQQNDQLIRSNQHVTSIPLNHEQNFQHQSNIQLQVSQTQFLQPTQSIHHQQLLHQQSINHQQSLHPITSANNSAVTSNVSTDPSTSNIQQPYPTSSAVGATTSSYDLSVVGPTPAVAGPPMLASVSVADVTSVIGSSVGSGIDSLASINTSDMSSLVPMSSMTSMGSSVTGSMLTSSASTTIAAIASSLAAEAGDTATAAAVAAGTTVADQEVPRSMVGTSTISDGMVGVQSVVGGAGVSAPTNMAGGLQQQVILHQQHEQQLQQPGQLMHNAAQRSSNMMPHQQQQQQVITQHQVHTVAIPGAVVRLPQGVTPQQLQMMGHEERQNFLLQLHQKQRSRHPRQQQAGPGQPVAAQQTQFVSGGAAWQTSTRSSTPQQQQQLGPQQQQQHAAAAAASDATAATNVVWTGQQQQQQPGEIVQQVPPEQQQHQQQQQQHVVQTLVPQLVRPPSTPGGAHYVSGRVVVSQWQSQQPQQVLQPGQPQPAQPSPTQQLLLPQQAGLVASGHTMVRAVGPGGGVVAAPSMQIMQNQVALIRQQFPQLSPAECHQVLTMLPVHLREMQGRDNAGRSEYLGTLPPKERQVVTYFHMRRHHNLMQRQAALQQQQLAQQQAGVLQGQQQVPQLVQQKTVLQQSVSPLGWQSGQPQVVTATGLPVQQSQQPQQQGTQQQFGAVRPINPLFTSAGQATQLLVSPGASPHPHHQDSSLVAHSPTGSLAVQGIHPNLVNQKTKTALANLLSNRLGGGGSQQLDLSSHILHKVSGDCSQGGEQVVIYRRTLTNIPGGAPGAPAGSTIVRPAGAVAHHVSPVGYPRPAGPHSPHSGAGVPVSPNIVAGGSQHYPRPHLFGHDTNIMLPRELCLVGCVFYIADYHAELLPHVIDTWRRVIQQHGGEVNNIYDGSRVTHILCKNQQSPVFLLAMKENKRCITVFWLNDILLRGKMAPPWQAIHLPTPFGNDNKPCKDMIISVTGFENEEKSIIKLMLQLVGAKHTGNFSRKNHILISKKFEGSASAKVAKAREWRKPIVNGIWLSEVLLGQNVPPLVCHGTKYQHQLDDPLRIDPSLALHLFNAWKFPISVSKESVEKAKAVRENALRKRKTEVIEGELDNKRPRIDVCLSQPIPELSTVLPSPSPPADGNLPPESSNIKTEIQQGDIKTEKDDIPSSDGTDTTTAATYDSSNNNLTTADSNLTDGKTVPTTEPETAAAATPTPAFTKKKTPVIFFSSVRNKPEMERKVIELGGRVTGSAQEATHLVMGGDGRVAPRTVNFMCAVSCCSHVVSLAWLLHSHHFNTFLREDKYVLQMPEFEQLFDFSLEKTLAKPNRRQLLSSRVFYLTPSVVPGRRWLRQIIECAGGVVEPSRRSLSVIRQLYREKSNKYFVIAIERDEHLVKDLLAEKIPVHTAEFVLGSILRQEVMTDMALYSS